MKRGAAWFLHLTMFVVGGTGLLWARSAYVWDAGPEPEEPELLLEWTGIHPWTPALRTAHLFGAPALVFAVGLIWASHVAPRLLKPWARRASGLLLALLLLPVVASGVALQTAASSGARNLWVWLHGLSSALWVLAYLAHQLSRGRGRRPGRAQGVQGPVNSEN